MRVILLWQKQLFHRVAYLSRHQSNIISKNGSISYDVNKRAQQMALRTLPLNLICTCPSWYFILTENVNGISWNIMETTIFIIPQALVLFPVSYFLWASSLFKHFLVPAAHKQFTMMISGAYGIALTFFSTVSFFILSTAQLLLQVMSREGFAALIGDSLGPFFYFGVIGGIGAGLALAVPGAVLGAASAPYVRHALAATVVCKI